MTDCSDLLWHVDIDAKEQGCTNYNTDLSTRNSTLLFQTAEECCASSFEGLDCSVRDNCKKNQGLIFASLNVPLPEHSCDNMWHPEIEIGGCSNSLQYPDSYNLPQNRDNLLFDTAQECCQKLYTEQGNDCMVYNKCITEAPTDQPTPTEISDSTSTSSCETAKWHISNGSDKAACSNSRDYPDYLDDPGLSGNFLFDSHFECCARYFADPLECGRHYDCVDESATGSSAQNTPGPTHKPTRMPTRKPVYLNDDGNDNCSGKLTKKQCAKAEDSGCMWNNSYNSCVRAATGDDKGNEGSAQSPSSCDGRKWHPKTNADRTCSNSLGYSGQFYFGSFKECCKAFFDRNCIREDVC